MSDYSGDDIVIEEMPQGCVITGEKGTVVISSTQDALAVIASLQLMLKVQMGETEWPAQTVNMKRLSCMPTELDGIGVRFVAGRESILMGINVLSLFDGMACGLVALKRAGIQVDNYYASEIDKYAMQIAKKNHPEIIYLGDVQNWQSWNLPKIDLLIGGSPCQGFSNAGEGKNFDDPRSKLFFTYVEIRDELHRKNPELQFLLENVKMKQIWQDVINDEMGVFPVEINSALVSAQNRKRLYWANWKIEQPEDKKLTWVDVMEVGADNVFYYTEGSFAWINKSEKRKNKFKIYDIDTEEKMQMIEASHYKGYSNERCFGIRDMTGIRYISCIECERLQTLEDNYTSGVSNTQRYKMIGNGWTVDVITYILKSNPKLM